LPIAGPDIVRAVTVSAAIVSRAIVSAAINSANHAHIRLVAILNRDDILAGEAFGGVWPRQGCHESRR
jgi:hypothetical protein